MFKLFFLFLLARILEKKLGPETSRSIHERDVEHLKDAESFSLKSHIVKHWRTAHPELDSPPPMDFKITAMYRDCLYRPIDEDTKQQREST